MIENERNKMDALGIGSIVFASLSNIVSMNSLTVSLRHSRQHKINLQWGNRLGGGTLGALWGHVAADEQKRNAYWTRVAHNGRMAGAALLCFLALAATASFAHNPVKWTNMYVKWSMPPITIKTRANGYYKIPLTTEKARKAGWTQAASSDYFTTWCFQEDPRVCPLYSSKGHVAGMQISLPVADFAFPDNDTVDNHPQLHANNMYDTELLSARYFLVDQAMLAAGGRPPSAEIGTGLWLQSGPDLVEVPRDGDQLAARNWTRQNCIPGMGRHYYYDLSRNMSCADFQPLFLLMNNDNNYLQGVGFQMIGTPSVKSRIWFEPFPPSAIDDTLPSAPDCLKEQAGQHGIISIHTYFVDKPWAISC